MLRIIEILGRVSVIIKSTENQEIAKALKVEDNTCSGWKNKNRNTIPWAKLFEFCRERNLSFDWLLTGKEAKAKQSLSSEVIEIFGIARYIEEINEAVEKGYYETALGEMERCISHAKDVYYERKRENIKKKDNFNDGISLGSPKLNKVDDKKDFFP